MAEILFEHKCDENCWRCTSKAKGVALPWALILGASPEAL
jgi:hypothetical protein